MKGSSKVVSKAIGKLNDTEGNKHKDDRLKSFDGVITQADTSAGASVLGRTSVTMMKNLE